MSEKPLRQTSIHKGLLTSLTAVLLLSMVVLVGMGYVYYSMKTEAEVQNQADVFMESLSTNLERLMWTMDYHSIANVGLYYESNPEIVSLSIVDSFGEKVFSFDKKHPGSTVKREKELVYRGREIGTVSLTLSKAVSQEKRMQLLWTALFLAVTIGVTLLLVTNLILRRYLKGPLAHLNAMADSYANNDFDLEDPISPCVEFQGVVTAMVFMGRTIKAKIAELKQAEEDYRSIFENAVEGMVQTTPDAKILRLNPAVAQMLGFETPAEAIRNKDLFPDKIYVIPEDRERFMDLLRTVGAVRNFETKLLRKDGKQIHVSINATGIFENGKLVRLDSMMENITERKHAEEELERLRNYLVSMINSMPSLLVGVDADCTVTQWNREAERVTGKPREAVIGKPLEDVVPDMAPEMEKVREAMRNKTIQTWTKSHNLDQGETRYQDVIIYPLAAKGMDGAVLRMDDVTEKVRLQEMMLQSEKMLSVGGLAAGMAHEINNPLAAIIGYTYNIRKRTFGDLKANLAAAEECGTTLDSLRCYLEKRGVAKMLDGIHESGDRAAKIVSNVLSFSRKSEKRLGSHNLTPLLESTLDLAASDYNMKKQYDFRKIEIVREYDPDLPPVYCEGTELQQVFFNLLKNGAEAMAEKDFGDEPPRFILRTRREDKYGVVEIEDNGPGLSDSVRKRIFEPFFTTKQVGMGTGLGLSVSYFIVTEQHNGIMEVHSVPGRWTRFVIKLPFSSEDSIDVSGSTDTG